jgi:REP element-mobilizing transposase RayT
MPRKPREDVAGGIHHVVAKGVDDRAIVVDDHDRDVLLDRLGGAVFRHRWSCLAYCLLSTHLHLVVGTARPNLGIGMQWLLGPYAQAFNRKHDRRGHLFGGRYYSTRVQSENHLVAALTYVELNPVRAGLVESPEHWPWSSYAATVGRRRAPDFLDVDAVLDLVDSDHEKARLRFALAVREAQLRRS